MVHLFNKLLDFRLIFWDRKLKAFNLINFIGTFNDFLLNFWPSWTRKANQFSYLFCSSKISIKKFPLKFTIPTLNLNSSKMENLTEINSAIKLNNFVFIKQSKNEMNKKSSLFLSSISFKYKNNKTLKKENL